MRETEAKALRRQIRDWRDGRANTRLIDAMSDAYVSLFATVMLGAMAFNMVRQLRLEAADACTTGACTDARTALPWVFAVGAVATILLLARLFGPLLASPAEGSWLLSSPIDRRALMLPRLAIAAVLSLAAGALLGAVDATIGGFGAGSAAEFTLILAAASLCVGMFAAIGQARERRGAQIVIWVLSAFVWVGLILITLGLVPSRLPERPHLGSAGIGVGVFLLVTAAFLAWRAAAGLAHIRKDQLTASGSVLSNLSGAFAILDLGLVYDILMARRWRQRSAVRPVRGGPGGAWALAWRDVVRLRRSIHTVFVLAASLVVPYVAATLGLGKAVPAVGALTGFLAGLGLCSGLRVLSRTPGLIRCFPMSAPAVRLAGIAVPGGLLVIWGMASTPAIHRAMAPDSWPGALAVGVAVGLAAVTAIARWITAPPADYSGPLVSTSSGAIPPGLFGNILRGLDVLLLLTAPLLLAEPMTGAVISIGLAGIVLAVVLNRRGPAV